MDSVKSSVNPRLVGIISHLSTPLYRNGYALALSSTTTSLIGGIYWILAAHLYSARVVGLNSAMISAMMLLAGIAELNLMSALIRFIPVAGRSTRRFVFLSYLVSVLIAAAVSLIFMVYIKIWAPELGFFGKNPTFILWFTISTIAYCIFVLQDSVLTGLRMAVWVPVENTLFSLAKIVLLILFAAVIPLYGIYASWAAALAVTVLPTNYFIFRRFIGQHIRTTETKAEVLKAGHIARFVAADYIGSSFWLFCTMLLPVIVTKFAGATMNAYFYMSWTIAYALYLISPNMGSSLIVEAASDQQNLGVYSQRILVQTARIVVPAAVFIFLVAPWLLSIFGRDYAVQGSTLLRLLALSAIPNIFTSLSVSIARVQRRMRAVVIILGALCLLVLSLSYFFLRFYGITGVGLAWLISQIIVSAALFIFYPRIFRITKMQLVDLFFHIMDNFHLRPPAYRPWNFWRERQQMAKISSRMPVILKNIPYQDDSIAPVHWVPIRKFPTVTEMSVVLVGLEGKSDRAILKLARSCAAAISMEHQAEVLTALKANDCLGEWRSLLPTLILIGENNGQVYELEEVLPGISADRFLSKPVACEKILAGAVEAISELHRRTCVSHVPDPETIQDWVEERIQILRDLDTRFLLVSRDYQAHEKLDKLEKELCEALRSRLLATSWVHGDLAPGNILVSPEDTTVTGIIDWEMARPKELPIIDLIHLFISTRMYVKNRELGMVVRDLLHEAKWASAEQALMDSAQKGLPGERIDFRTGVLLCWLRHVTASLTNTTRFARHRYWLTVNIDLVLRIL